MKQWMKKAMALILSSFVLMQPLCAAEESTKGKGEILIELSSGTVLYEEQADERLPMASLTKLMGLILIGEALEREELRIDEVLTCSEYAKSMGGSEIWLKEGEQMSVDDLLKAVMIVSANDAMVVLAERLGASEEGFVQMMNQKAQDLGLTNTHFVNATGFDEEEHYTSARDVATMAQQLQVFPQLLDYAAVWMDSLRNGETMLVNTNRLVRFYQGTTGLKTGTTDAAGYCLCATAQRGELNLCSVVLGCDSSEGRFERSEELLDYGFSQYACYYPEEVFLEPLAVIHGTKSQVELIAQAPPRLILPREWIPKLQTKLPEFKSVQAPLTQGQQIGEVKLYVDEEEIAAYPICVKETVESLSFGKCLELLLKSSVSVE